MQTIVPYLTIKGAGEAVAFYQKAFDAKENARHPAVLARIAATPIVPAPMKRTWVRQTCSACVSRSTPSGAGCRNVRIGTPKNQAMAPVSGMKKMKP